MSSVLRPVCFLFFYRKTGGDINSAAAALRSALVVVVLMRRRMMRGDGVVLRSYRVALLVASVVGASRSHINL